MNKVLFIVGEETVIGRKLANYYRSAGWKVASALFSEEDRSEDSEDESKHLYWNRSSLFSAKGTVREAIRRFKKLDMAIIVNCNSGSTSPLQGQSIAEIDEVIDNYVKGNSYIIREVMHELLKHESPILAFVNPEETTECSSVDNGTFHFFKGFSDSILLQKIANLYKCGFQTDTDEPENYCNFITKMLDEQNEKANGEWLKHSTKKALFSSLPIVKRQ